MGARLWLPSLDKSVVQAIYSAYTGPENPDILIDTEQAQEFGGLLVHNSTKGLHFSAFISVGDYSDIQVEFSGSIYKELVDAIKQQAPSECFSTNQEIASLQIFSEQLDEYVELTPERVKTVKDSSKISVNMEVGC